MQRPEASRHAGRDIPAQIHARGLHQLVRDRRSQVDHQQVTPRPQVSGAYHGGQPVFPQRLRRLVIDPDGQGHPLVQENKARQSLPQESDQFLVAVDNRRQDSLRESVPLQQRGDHGDAKPLIHERGFHPSLIEYGDLRRRVSLFYNKIHFFKFSAKKNKNGEITRIYRDLIDYRT